jgi:hypothetical protein
MNHDELVDTQLAAQNLIFAGRHAEAIEPLRRCHAYDPSDQGVALDLFDSLVHCERLDEAETMVADLRARWASDEPVLVALAELRESQRRLPEALALIQDLNIDVGASALAYSDYLRILVENQRWDEAVIESLRGIDDPAGAKGDAWLTRVFSTLALDEPKMAADAAQALEQEQADEVVEHFLRRTKAAGVLPMLRRLLDGGVAAQPGSAALKRLRDRFDDSSQRPPAL